MKLAKILALSGLGLASIAGCKIKTNYVEGPQGNSVVEQLTEIVGEPLSISATMYGFATLVRMEDGKKILAHGYSQHKYGEIDAAALIQAEMSDTDKDPPGFERKI